MPEIWTRDRLLAELDREQAALMALLPHFSDEEWRGRARADGWTAHDITAHVADSTYGLALMVLGEIPATLPVDPQTGWINPDELNERRRQQNAELSRDKLMSRLPNSFAQARRAIETIADYDAPGPYGEVQTRGRWLARIVEHLKSHRTELEEMAGLRPGNRESGLALQL
jgi:hypothetical protein